MLSILLSDAHLHGLADPNQAALVGFLRALQADELVLVGDIFDVWWGFRGVVPSGLVPFLAVLAELRARGVRITWVPGNHDLRLGPVIEEELGISVQREWRSGGGLRVVAIHGDEADQSRSQRALTRLLHSNMVDRLAQVAGPRVTWGIAARLSRHSRAAGGPGLEHLLDAQRKLADERLKTCDVLCVGHTHAPGIEVRAGGTLVNLGDWLHHHTYAVVDEGVELFQWDGHRGVPLLGGMRRRV